MRRYPAGEEAVLVVRAPVEGRAVTPGDIERQVGARLRRLPAGPMREAAEAALRGAATRHPPITDLRPAADGGVWVRETPREGTDSVAWVVLARDGAPRGRLWLADTDRPLVMRDSSVLLVRDGRAEGATLVRAVLRGP